MIIIASAVKAYKPIFNKLFYVRRTRINHSNNGFSLALFFPVNKEQIRKHLDVIKYERRVFIVDRYRRLVGLKMHLVNKLDAILCLVRTISSKVINAIAKISNVIAHSAIIRVLKYFKYKVHARFCCRVILFIKVLGNHRPKSFFIFHSFKIYQFSFSFQRQT